MSNKFIKYIEKQYGLDDFCEILFQWLNMELLVNLPELILNFPENILQEFKVYGCFYRGIVIGNEEDLYLNNSCSWSFSIETAKIFIENPLYIKDIQEEGKTAYGVIYRYKGESISLNKIINCILSYINLSNLEKSDNIEDLIESYENFQEENEHIAKFELSKVDEVYRCEH